MPMVLRAGRSSCTRARPAAQLLQSSEGAVPAWLPHQRIGPSSRSLGAPFGLSAASTSRCQPALDPSLPTRAAPRLGAKLALPGCRGLWDLGPTIGPWAIWRALTLYDRDGH